MFIFIFFYHPASLIRNLQYIVHSLFYEKPCHRTRQLSDYYYPCLLLQTAKDTAADQATRAPVPVPAGQGGAGALLGCGHPLQETRTRIPGQGRCK